MLQLNMHFEVRFTSFLSIAVVTPMTGLAENLHSELQLYGVDVHIYYPNTIFTPGFEEECKTKPEISQILEGTVEGFTPAECANILFNGEGLPKLFCAML